MCGRFRDAAIDNDMNVHTRPLKQEVAYVQASKPGSDTVIAADFDSGVYFRRVAACDELQRSLQIVAAARAL